MVSHDIMEYLCSIYTIIVRYFDHVYNIVNCIYKKIKVTSIDMYRFFKSIKFYNIVNLIFIV